ncbi:formate dehydrogenase accessory sulfurtransferase FdhD [Clostridium sp. OS1-26]|uniref:formate dehydrogenase accessory sulfurtransferase FdhD n=1 Tax=Clostridium sp. OS1-26 TaxID=3070681 RepID=UPI0027E1B2E4|nr:formate dehydrogenase accessory sulfurtransferase FdhD [Clostridium sp. OS1-26]WML35713.1 formate dehydrogenase accessory sulfurtransferase FdhD [Clostridium sp. OS1-26]
MIKIKKYPVIRYDKHEKESSSESMIYEYPLSLFVNEKHIATLLCTHEKLDALVWGFLRTQGIISDMNEVESFELDEKSGVVKIKLDANNDKQLRQLLPVGFNEESRADFFSKLVESLNCKAAEDNCLSIDVSKVYELMEENLSYSEAFKQTGGAHCVALSDGEKIVVICEDVARHNAMDKAIGEALMQNISLNDKIIFISGRVSFEMILKVARFGLPIVISKSAPTSLSIELAQKLNITLAGFVRGEKMKIYTCPYRIK